MARWLPVELKLPKLLSTCAVMASAYIANRCSNNRIEIIASEALTRFKSILTKMHGSVQCVFANTYRIPESSSQEVKEAFLRNVIRGVQLT